MKTRLAFIDPTKIVSLEIDSEHVRIKLASGRCLCWKNRNGFTIHGEKLIAGLEADRSDCLSAEGLVLHDNKGADWQGYVECPRCHEWHKSKRSLCMFGEIRSVGENSGGHQA